jgi:hypothetical protein
MLLLPTQKYIFDQSSSLVFYEKLNTFQEYFIDQVLLMGVAKNGTCIRKIDFEKNLDHGELYYSILIEAIFSTAPFAISELIKDNRREMQCCFYDFGAAEGVRYIYMLHNAMDWTNKNDFCCQLYSLVEPNQDTIHNFWSA